jgi:hypothetical protein
MVAGLTPKRKGATPSTSSLSSLSQDNRATRQPAVQRKGAASSSLSPPPASAMDGAGADSEPEDAVGVDDLVSSELPISVSGTDVTYSLTNSMISSSLPRHPWHRKRPCRGHHRPHPQSQG